MVGVRLTSNFVTTSSSNTDTALTIPVLANEVWALDFTFTATSPAAGISFQISAPTAATVEGFVQCVSLNGSAASPLGRRFTAINTLSGVSSTASILVGGIVSVVVSVGANAGNVALGAASVTNTQSTTINAGAKLLAQRLA